MVNGVTLHIRHNAPSHTAHWLICQQIIIIIVTFLRSRVWLSLVRIMRCLISSSCSLVLFRRAPTFFIHRARFPLPAATISQIASAASPFLSVAHFHMIFRNLWWKKRSNWLLFPRLSRGKHEDKLKRFCHCLSPSPFCVAWAFNNKWESVIIQYLSIISSGWMEILLRVADGCQSHFRLAIIFVIYSSVFSSSAPLFWSPPAPMVLFPPSLRPLPSIAGTKYHFWDDRNAGGYQ